MTYNYRYWTAFREADLLKAGDHSINNGDSFTMPGAATVKLAAYDNDGQLSGDYNDKATDSDGHYDQYGWVNDGSGWQKTGDLYVEKVFTLKGSDGKTYHMAEIEGEGHDAAGEGDDYFSFVGAVPPAGVTLKVVSNAESHGVNYNDLSADAPAHVNNAPTFDNAPANGVIHVNENETAVIDLNASDADGDTLTYAITGGADAAFFKIDAHTGELSFKSAPDFENAQDVSGQNNVYDVTVTVSDGNGGTTTKAMWVKVQDVDEHVNTAPVFNNLPANGVIMLDENNTMVIDANATDADGDHLTYSITGGADAAFFNIDAATGKLTFKNAPDFENPADVSGQNNVYDVTITVSDGNGGSDTKAMWVKVQDVDENTGGELECVVIEAEDMNAWGFHTVHGNQASGGELVKLGYKGTGDLSTTFEGSAGTYDLTLFAQDETDGQSTVMVKVNGEVVQTIKLDKDNNGGGSDHGGFSEFTVEGLELEAGDTIGLWARADNGEFVRIDKIKLQQTEAEEVDPNLVCLDFEGLNAGTVVNNQFDGVMISAQRATHNTAANDAMIFDSNNPTGGDHDLATNNQNNILIVSEDNDSHDPDDAIGGTIWFKFDNPATIDSIKVIDAEEGGTIRLLDENGQLIKTVNIPNGTNGGIQTVEIDAEGVAQIDLTLNGSGAVDDLKYIPGQAPELGSLGGTYFMDNNDNSVEDAGDMTIAGATVWLLQNGAIIATTTTDADGNYLFEDLEAGNYVVRFDEQDGKTFVDGNVGGDDTVDSDVTLVGGAGNGNTSTITLGAGEDKRNVDAGVEVVDTGDAVIRGRVFMDNNDNSVDDNGDMGVAGVTVTLSNGDTTVTDADGNYEFTGLPAGDYTVTFPTEVDGKVLVDSNVGGDDTVDSDAGANGSTGTITVGIGEVSEDNDAGVEDPGTASIGDKVFLDANGNGQQDPGEQGVDGVQVTLFNAAGMAISTVTTTNGGMYLFDELDAGDYTVGFEAPVGFDLTEANIGNDASDSDADQGTGRTGTINLEIGEAERTVDAGLVEENDAPVAGDDEAIGCAEDDIVVDVLANDSDPDGDAIAVTSVGGQAINEGETVTVDGVEISLVGGQLVFNGAAQFEDLTIGEEATVSYDYHVSDGNGGVTDASVEVTFKGDANSVQDLFDSLPASGTYQIAADNEADPIGDAAYDMLLNGTGDARFDGVVFNQAYCLSFFDPLNAAETFADAPSFTADVTDGKDGSVFLAGQTSFANGNAAADNLDLVNYILAQDYENDASGQYTGWEVQLAIWELTDDVNSSDIIALDPAYGDQADVDAIVADAIANGEGFMAGTGDITSFIVDPNPATATNSQPFIVAIDFEDFDCLC